MISHSFELTKPKVKRQTIDEQNLYNLTTGEFMKKYKIGFSIKGLIEFLLVMVPNIIWEIYPPANDVLSTNSSSIAAVNIVMSISQWIMMALLILLRRTAVDSKVADKMCVSASAVCLGIYYVCWICYYLEVVSPLMLLGMAVLPCCFFSLFILWQKIYIVLIPTAIFSALHIGVTCINFVLAK